MSIASKTIIGSPDITTLAYSILYDVSGPIPAITLTNESTVVNPTALKWWYVITTPSGTPIHTGSLASPDANLVDWTTLSITAGAWPTPFGTPPCSQVEFSNNSPYVCTLYVYDSDLNTFSLTVNQAITRPNGNTLNSCGNFGVSAVVIEVKCNDRVVFCADSTNFTYQSILQPTTQSNTWTLVYPQDPNGNQPANAVFTNTPYVNFPVGYSGNGYVLNLRNYATYDMGNGVYLSVQYKAINPETGGAGIPFAVLCNIDLCKLQCQIATFEKLGRQKCGNVVNPELNNQIVRMGLLLSQAIIGVMQPLCGIDVPKIVKEIQSIGNLDENCDCGCKDTGINFSYPTSPGANTGACCPVSVSIINITSSPLTSCESTVYPVQVFAPGDFLSIVGIAGNMTELLYLLNSSILWNVYGTAFSEGSCKIGWFPATAGNTIPNVYIASSSNSTACVGNQQRYTVRMQDLCSVATSVSAADFPLNAYVDFGSGEVSLGSVADVAALVVALNATPTKPSTVTFSDVGSVAAVTINIFNSSCTSFSTPITVSTDIGSSSFLLYGSSHLNYSSTPETINGGVDAYGLRGNVIAGKIPGISATNIQWHNIKIGNTLIVAESDTGKIHFIDVAIPLSPSYIRYIQLNRIVSNSFTGLPLSKGIDGGAVHSYYSLYFPTDYSNMPLNSIAVCEASTGTFWGLDMGGFAAGIGTGSINSGGTGWVVGDLFSIGTTGGLVAVGQATSVSAGVVTGWMLLRPGEGYSVTTGVACAALTGVGVGLILNILTIQTGVISCFQDNKLRGMCPRVFVGSKLFFTLDGSLAADMGVPAPVADGYTILMDFSLTFIISPLNVMPINIAGSGTVDPIWTASYDGVDTIWFMCEKGVLYKYSVSLASASVITGAMGIIGGFILRGNMKYSMNALYCTSLGRLRTPGITVGTMSVDVSDYPTVTQTFFEEYPDVNQTYKFSHNALPLGNCLVLVTGEGYQAASPPGAEYGAVAVYKTDGTFLQLCRFGDGQNVYNLAAISGVGTPYTPTTLIPV